MEYECCVFCPGYGKGLQRVTADAYNRDADFCILMDTTIFLITMMVREEMQKLDSSMIQRILPHRPPFLLVDRILQWGPGQQAVGSKNVTANEPVLAGHFPGQPIYPGVLVIESLAQVGALLLLRDQEAERNRNG